MDKETELRLQRLEAQNNRYREVLVWYSKLPEVWNIEKGSLIYEDLKLLSKRAEQTLTTDGVGFLPSEFFITPKVIK